MKRPPISRRYSTTTDIYIGPYYDQLRALTYHFMHPFSLDGIIYQTSIAAACCLLTESPTEREYIRAARSGMLAMERFITARKIADWKLHQKDMLVVSTLAKIASSPQAAAELRSTGQAAIHDESHFVGWCENLNGEALMIVRTRLLAMV